MAFGDDDGIERLTNLVEAHHGHVKAFQEQVKKNFGNAADMLKAFDDRAKSSETTLNEVKAHVADMEQKLARRPGAGPQLEAKTLGEHVVASDGFKAFVANGVAGTARIPLETKTITSSSGSAGVLIPPDVRVSANDQLPKRRLTIRALVAPGSTTSNAISFPRQVSRTNAAAPVAENPSAPKPQSDGVWEMITTPVKTLAHWIPMSKQIFDDAPLVSSLIDQDLRYGLDEVEENLLFAGDGTGENLKGIKPQSTAFSASLFTSVGIQNPTALDVLLIAAAQAELARYPATGLVLHPIDYAKLLAMKDTQNRYLCGGPLADAVNRFWSLPMVTTEIQTQGRFLIGAFADAAQIFDRQDATVLVSTEDRDNFVKNMVTVLAEKRLAFVVKRSAAFIEGPLAPPTP